MSPMHDDVLAPFENDWRERQKAIEEAIARLGSAHETPRLEPWTDRAGRARFTLIRSDGAVRRLSDRTAKAVTTRFTPEEWAMIERVVLLRHGLAPATLNQKEQ